MVRHSGDVSVRALRPRKELFSRREKVRRRHARIRAPRYRHRCATPTFRFITHDTTLQQVIDRLGPASRVVELALRHRDGDTEHFKAHEYDLPYNAAVVVMPQRPSEAEDKIRAVYMRKAPADDWLSVES